jgi:hypothetical protein
MLKAQAQRKFKDTKVKVSKKLKDLLGNDDEDSEDPDEQQ